MARGAGGEMAIPPGVVDYSSGLVRRSREGRREHDGDGSRRGGLPTRLCGFVGRERAVR